VIRRVAITPTPPPDAALVQALKGRLDTAAQARLGRSLALRHVDAGSCGGCELELRAVAGAVHDLARLGLRFVASPRHADVLLLTGPLTGAMREAVERTWDAMPDPKWVVAVGECAVDGGVFRGSYAVLGGVDTLLPVDLAIRGCPPSPLQILAALAALVEANA
jgi:Ni,Fe-hydrogenase III small subunit